MTRTPERAAAFILARPGPLRDGMQALLSAVPALEVVGATEDTGAVLKAAQAGRIDLVLVDLGLPDGDGWGALRQIGAVSPSTRRVALADDVRQQLATNIPAAEAVVLQGLPPGQLIEAIEAVLAAPRSGPAK